MLPQDIPFKSDFILEAPLAGIFKADLMAQQQRQAELDAIQKQLANERYAGMTPGMVAESDLTGAQSTAMNTPENIRQFVLGKIGSQQQQQALGESSMAELPTKISKAHVFSRFNKFLDDATNPDLPQEVRDAARRQAQETGTFLAESDPANVAKLAQVQAKSAQGQQSKLAQLAYKEISEARLAGRAPADWAVAVQNDPMHGFETPQQQPVQPVSGAYTLRIEDLTPEDRAIVQQLTSVNPKDSAAVANIDQQLRAIASKYQQKQSTTAGAGALQPGQILKTFDKTAPVPSNDTPDSFTGASGETYTPKNAEEREVFTGLAAPYRQPGQLVSKANKLTTTMANEVGVTLQNLSILTNRGEKVPSAGAWSNLKNDTLFSASAANMLTPFTKQETLQLEALVKPLARMQSVLEYGGSGGTQADRDRMEAAIVQKFGTADRVVALQKFGELKQAVEAALKSHAADQMMTREQRESLLKNYRKVNEAFPFTATDVLKWQSSGMKVPFAEYIDGKSAVNKYLGK